MDVEQGPFEVLGLTSDATLADVRDARRRLAREHHPDLHPERGGDAAVMQRVNEAFDACVGHLTSRRLLHPRGEDADDATPPSPEPPPPSPRVPRTRFRGVEVDSPSFTIDALPAEAYEALLVVATWIGEVLDDDPPYVLECVLDAPLSCWCRLEVVPDAGSSTVSLIVAGIDGPDHPSAEEVRDEWVAHLNQLGRPQP